MNYSPNDYRYYTSNPDYLEHALGLKLPKIKKPSIKLPKLSKPKLSLPKRKTSSTKSTIKENAAKAKSKATDFIKKFQEDKEDKDESAPVEKEKWEWPGGKNSKEYNHWYWVTNKEKILAKRKQRMGSADANTEEKEYEFNDKYWSNKETDSNKLEGVATALAFVVNALAVNPEGFAMNLRRFGQAGQAYVKQASQFMERKLSDGPVDTKTGFKRKTKTMDRKADLAHVNPGFKNFDTNTKNNCMLCTTTYDLRRRGYDVTAKTATRGFYPEDVTRWYPDAEVKTVKSEPIPVEDFDDPEKYWAGQKARAKKNADKLIKELEKQPEGARGNLMVTWAGATGGHSMVYEIIDGEVVILDGQSNKVYEDPYEILMKTDFDYTYARLDNVDINPEMIRRCSKS